MIDMVICSNCNEKETTVKDLCRPCYMKRWRKNNPKKLELCVEKHRKENIEQYRIYRSRRYYINRGYSEFELDEMGKPVRKFPIKGKRLNKTCRLLKQHSDDMVNDSDSLSTDFIMNMIDAEFDDFDNESNSGKTGSKNHG